MSSAALLHCFDWGRYKVLTLVFVMEHMLFECYFVYLSARIASDIRLRTRHLMNIENIGRKHSLKKEGKKDL